MNTGIDWNDKHGLVDIGIDIATEEYDMDRTDNDIQQLRHGGCAIAMLAFFSMTPMYWLLDDRLL